MEPKQQPRQQQVRQEARVTGDGVDEVDRAANYKKTTRSNTDSDSDENNQHQGSQRVDGGVVPMTEEGNNNAGDEKS